jgi:Na+/melibiose symporter-like transporter
VAAIALTAVFVPESRAPRARRVDPVGQVLVIAALAALTYAIIEGPSAGWTSARILGCFGLAAAALIGLAGYEPRRQEPLLDLRFFRSVPFSGATVTAVCAFAALGGFLFLNTLYLQEVRGYSALHAGLYTLPMAAMTVLLSPVSGRIVAARGPRLPTVVAGVATLASGIMLTRLARDTSFGYLILSYVIFGIGSGLVNPPITNAAVSGMPVSQAGVAAGIASTSRQVGTALGVAVVGSAALSALHGSFRLGFAAASHAGWWIIAGCGAAILLLGLVTSGRWARSTAERAAGLLITPAGRVPVSAP